MSMYPVQTVESAPEASRPALQQLEKAFGMIPNIAAVLSNSPKLIQSLVGVFQQVHTSSLTEQEIQIVLLTDAVVNRCSYAVAFHTALARQAGISAQATDAVRAGRLPDDTRLAALSNLATALISTRGHITGNHCASFLQAGFTHEQILEVIAVVAASTITNYAGTLANPPLEEAFQPYAWDQSNQS